MRVLKINLSFIFLISLFIINVTSQFKLVTFNRQGKKINILNKNGDTTKLYRGGIWGVNIRNGIIINIHKKPDPIESKYWNRHKYNPNPKFPRIQNRDILPLDIYLFTKNPNGEFISILKKTGYVTDQRYKGGIWVNQGTGFYVNIHKPPELGYIQNNQNAQPPIPPRLPKQRRQQNPPVQIINNPRYNLRNNI